MGYNKFVLEFEKPLVEVERQIEELAGFSETVSSVKKKKALQNKLAKLQKDIYSKLSPWQRVQLARHPSRPYALDYIKEMTDDFTELHGDRRFADDKAIIAGLARIGGRSVVIVSQQKGRTTKEKMECHFGCPHPEGYRKAMRVMRLAERFKKPIITLIDTQGAYPGVGAEERGQSEAIADNIKGMMTLGVPVIAVVIGEGGSGGALGIGIGDKVLMLENAYYSVITPEGCAAIIYRNKARAADAAEALKMTPEVLHEMGLIDGVISEPKGGAHKDSTEAARLLRDALCTVLDELQDIPTDELIEQRIAKFERMGQFKTV